MQNFLGTALLIASIGTVLRQPILWSFVRRDSRQKLATVGFVTSLLPVAAAILLSFQTLSYRGVTSRSPEQTLVNPPSATTLPPQADIPPAEHPDGEGVAKRRSRPS
jgi:hypothetical protein